MMVMAKAKIASEPPRKETVNPAGATTPADDPGKRKESGVLPDGLLLRMPTSRDGRAVRDLVARCEPLARDSVYCNLLRCTHYAETCVVAERNDVLVGFVSAYQPPNRPDTLFVWQVAVAPEERGRGRGLIMLRELLARPAGARAKLLETSIAADNAPSWSLFRRLATELRVELRRIPWFDAETHFGGKQATQILARIGPLPGARKDT